MIIFEDLEELKTFLRHDKGQQALTPVRFINTDSLSEWREMKNFLGTLTTDFIFLSDYCAGSDSLPNLRKLRNDLQGITRSVCVLPLSAFLRVNPERAAQEVKLFVDVFKGEIYSFRVYFLMYRLKDFFLSLKGTDPRKRECIILSAAATDECSLTIIQKSMQFNTAGERVDGFKQYFQRLEESHAATLTLYTAHAVHFQDKNFFDDVKVIANAFDLLRCRYALPAEFKRNDGREDHWQRLADLVAASGSFERAFCEEFKVDTFSAMAFKNFGDIEKFRQWLLWLRCKLQGLSYAARCANAADSSEDFAAQIYEQIFVCAAEKNFDDLCDERREILSLMKMLPPEHFGERVKSADKFIALKILTDNSQTERLAVFEILQRVRFSESAAARKILQRTFPALAKYLSEGAAGLTAEQAEYFRRYRWLKVTNRLTEDFNRRVAEIARNADETIYALKSRNEIVGAEYSDKSAIFFVDGLGAEYMNFFAADFASLAGNFSVKYQVGRCNLPSVTELNKDFLQGRNVAGEVLSLDTRKHENLPYPENILSELYLLTTLKEKILRAFKGYDKIILCADHGTSRLAVLARQTNFNAAQPAENRKVYKNGRFADALPHDAENFPNALEHDGKIIFADYSRFAQNGAPGNEIHGGAALEEILVPIISIERRKKN